MDKALPSQLKDFIDEDSYREIAKDMLAMANKLGASQAEVGLQVSTGLNVTVRMRDVETLEFNRDKAVGITVYIGKQKGSASTTDINKASLQSTVNAAISLAKLTEPDPFAGLASAADMASDIKDLDLYHPWDLTVQEAVNLAKNCEQAALSLDKKITNSEGATLSSSQGYHIYGNSHGFIGAYPTSRHSLSCTVIAEDPQGMERDYDYTISRQRELLENAEKIGIQAAQRALNRLSGKKLPTQQIPVLFHASIASGLISHFLGAISGGRLFRKTSFLLDSLNKKVFPDNIQIIERPHLLGALGSAPFDGDGVATHDKAIVKDGVVASYILSAYSARKLNLPNTANAGGTHNIFIEPTLGDFNSLLKTLGKGLVVTELMGPGINLVTGDYSRGAAGFWVENGEIKYPVNEVTIAGNLRTMFQQLIGVGNDVDTRSSIQTGSLLIEEMMLAGV
ncbi:MAG: metalloprotease PmbA [Proteobacteria bacterium]|nr:metalloprotease PmbA [Pseudomonadota bacterium]